MYHLIFYDKTIKEISDEDFEKFMSAITGDAEAIELAGSIYKFASVQKVLSHADFVDQYPQLNSDPHQPYTSSPGLGYQGVITNTKRLKALKRLGEGIKSVIARRMDQGLESPNATGLLNFARQRAKIIFK